MYAYNCINIFDFTLYLAQTFYITYKIFIYFLFAYVDHVNIVQNKSGYDVVNNSIVNAFNNPERSIVLDCVTVRGHENAVWIVQSSSENFDQSHYAVTIHHMYLSTIKITDPGMNISVLLKCMSDTSEYRIVTVKTGRC